MAAVPAELPNTAEASPPAVLLPYQQRWIADQSPFKAARKSRRTGLTWAEAADNVLSASSSREAGGQNVYYIAYNQDMTIEYIQACSMWCRAFNRAASEIEEGFWDESEEDKHIRTFTIRFPASGFRIVALSSRPSNLRGRQGIIVIDEAAFHEKLEELLKAALAMIIWGGKVRVISTLNGVDNPFTTLTEDIKAGRRKGTVHDIPFRLAVLEGLYRRVCLRLGIEWTQAAQDAWVQSVYDLYGAGADEELDCIPANSGGAWLSRALIEARMVDAPVLRWECKAGFETLPEHIRQAECQDWIDANLKPLLLVLDPQLQSGFGGDFGRSGDLSVFSPWQVTQQLKRRFPFLIELRNVPFRQQEQILFYMGDRLPRFFSAALDARGNGQYLAEVAMQRWGAQRVEMVMLTEGWYRENTAPFKAAFEDAGIELPRDADVLSDLRAFEVIRGVPRIPDKRTTDADGNKRHGDAGVSLLLGHYASRRDVAPIEFESLGSSRIGGRLDDYAEGGSISSRLGGYMG